METEHSKITTGSKFPPILVLGSSPYDIYFPEVIIKSARSKPRNLPCPRCSSTNTDFCNFVDDDLSRHLCKHCHSHWTNRDTPRDGPLGGGFLESYHPSFNNRVRTTPATSTPTTAATTSLSSSGGNNNIAHEIPYANPPSMVPQKGSGSSFNERVRKTPATSTPTAAAAASSSSSGGNNNIPHEFPHANPASMVPQMDSGSRPHDGFLNGLRNEAVPEAPDIRSSQIEVIPPAERDLSEQVDSQNFAFASSSDHGRPPMGPASDGDYLIIEIGDQNMPPVSLPDENRFQTANNNTILGITGQAAISLVFANQPVSTVARCFAAANGFGFLGSFLGNYAQKKPELAKILYKIGAIGAASAVIISLGSLLPEDTPWKLNEVATAASCLGVAYVVSTSKMRAVTKI